VRRRILGLFVAAAILSLGLEVARSATGREPYPALLMPSFSGSPDKGGTYTITRGELEVRDRTGGVHRMPAIELTEDAGVIPNSVLRLLAFERLDARGRPQDIAPRGGAALRIFGQHSGRTRDDKRALIDEPEVQNWLRDRVQDAVGQQDLRSARISWHDVSVDPDTENVVRDRVIKTVELFPR
jgi:hypothetical protein